MSRNICKRALLFFVKVSLPLILFIIIFQLGVHLLNNSTEIWMYPMIWHGIVLASFSSLIAPFGGFFASGFKRAFKIKVCFFY